MFESLLGQHVNDLLFAGWYLGDGLYDATGHLPG